MPGLARTFEDDLSHPLPLVETPLLSRRRGKLAVRSGGSQVALRPAQGDYSFQREHFRCRRVR